MRQSLAFILMISLAGLQFLAILIFVSTSYLTSERAMLAQAQSLMRQAGDNASDRTRLFLKPAGDIALQTARIVSSGVVSPSDVDGLEKFLTQKVLTESYVAGVYYGDQAGNFVFVMRSDGPGPLRTKIVRRDEGGRTTDLIWRDLDYARIASEPDPDDAFDPRARPWYAAASEERDLIWTEPYVFFSSGKPGLTAAAPVVSEDGSLLGVVGVDIELDDVSAFLSDLKVSPRSTVLIIDEAGRVISHPDSGQLLIDGGDAGVRLASIQELQDPVARGAFAEGALQDTLSARIDRRIEFRHDGESYLALLTPITGTEVAWNIGVHAPENDFVNAIKENRRRNIWIAGAVSLGTAIVGLLLADRILRPVRAFAVRTSLVSQGEVDPNLPLPTTYKELKRANETLISEIAQRRESEAKQAELSRQLFQYSRVDTLGQLATGLAHELSQPITAITQNVDAALSTAEKRTPPDEDLLNILKELDEQAHRGGDIIAALRGLVQKDKGAVTTFDLHLLLDQTARIVQHEAAAQHVKINLPRDAVHSVRANRVQIAQVLVNLMQNAMDAMENSDKKQITVTIVPRDTMMEVQIADTGPGVEPTVSLFKRFETTKSKGHGIGLSLSKTMIEANGGHIWYDTKHKLSRFCFTVPSAMDPS
ncbi:MAG: cache domain-containing protein [Pseudomonadota bacterium]